MGNCMHISYQVQEKKKSVRVITYSGEVLEFKGSTKAKKVTLGPYSGYTLVHRSQPFSTLHPKTKLKSGEVYYLIPDLEKVFSHNSRQKIKIVVTREDLEKLLGGSEKFQISRDVVFGHSDFSCDDQNLGGSPKWRPSLSSISEVKYF